MNIPTIKFEQNNRPLYFFVLNAKFIYANFAVSRRIEDKEKGYQRSFSKSRIGSIARYIDKQNGILPNSVLVNIDTDKFSYNENTKEITLLDDVTVGFIIDGQHRIWGANKAEKNILLPVVATVGLTDQEQAQLFVKINREQKGVPVSLYLDLLDLTEGVIDNFDDDAVPADRRAIEIAKRLNEDDESPLFELIRTAGESGRGIALNEFVNQIKQYVDPKRGKLVQFGFEDQYKLFKIYFKAIKSVFLEQWNDNNSLILKTVGFGGIMKAFHEVFHLVTQGGNAFSTQNTIMRISS